MKKWNSVLVPPDINANKIKAQEAKKKEAALPAVSEEAAVQPSSAGSSISSQSFPMLPLQMPAIHFHTNLLMQGAGGFMSHTLEVSVGKYPWIHLYPWPVIFPMDIPAGTCRPFILVLMYSPSTGTSLGLPSSHGHQDWRGPGVHLWLSLLSLLSSLSSLPTPAKNRPGDLTRLEDEIKRPIGFFALALLPPICCLSHM